MTELSEIRGQINDLKVLKEKASKREEYAALQIQALIKIQGAYDEEIDRLERELRVKKELAQSGHKCLNFIRGFWR